MLSFPSRAEDLQKDDLPFAIGEQLSFNIHYKWGFIMARAGSAHYSITAGKYDGKPTYQSTLCFRTTSGFDKIYKIRDTLVSHVNMAIKPVYHIKHLHEGSTNYVEDIQFLKFGEDKTIATSRRRLADGSTRFEETLEAQGIAYDMLNIFMFVRSLNYSKLSPGAVLPMSSFVGRDVVQMNARYIGQVILKKGGDNYKALKFELDIVDKAFETEKTAMELWISDDLNRYPLKMKAKLKIGAAEVDLVSFKGNKYPLSSLVTTKK